MKPDDLEAAYDLIAQALDDVGPDGERLFLAKLALALARETGDVARVRAAIATSKPRPA